MKVTSIVELIVGSIGESGTNIALIDVSGNVKSVKVQRYVSSTCHTASTDSSVGRPAIAGVAKVGTAQASPLGLEELELEELELYDELELELLDELDDSDGLELELLELSLDELEESDELDELSELEL